MKKVLLITLLVLAATFSPINPSAEARRGFTVGFGPMGNIYLIDTIPIMQPGLGGYTYFDYRFAEQVAFETSFFVSSQDGDKDSSGDDGILLLGIPCFDIKLYLKEGDPKFDPYVSTGLGMYIITEGAIGNDTGGAGMGAQFGVGFDYFASEMVSFGFAGIFRTLGIITDFGTPSNSSAIFPYSLVGNIAFHF